MSQPDSLILGTYKSFSPKYHNARDLSVYMNASLIGLTIYLLKSGQCLIYL